MTEREIFAAALEIADPSDRDSYLDVACGSDAALSGRVHGLLKALNRAGNFMQSPAVAPPAVEAPGSVIGPYKLLEQIGEGGMGLVFMAEQTEPIRRRVALKIIKPGMDTRQVVARFEAERQALALMDHPNIAKILDAGSTGEPEAQARGEFKTLACASGSRPFFVMELVRGVPITEFCDTHRYTPKQRLALFVTVCQAVQHAHQKGIIHRDLKPSNILVTLHDTVPVPKIIDFGIAKALDQRLTERTLCTNFAQMIGTPQYMSPEQAEMNGLDADTRSDVYALGVLLYELLTGTTPVDSQTLKQVGFDEMRRLIREDDPPRPSQRVSTLEAASLTTLSERRGVDGRRFGATLRGDLDWIVMKALEKDRNRRYESAGALAADVQRYLNDEPVEACPPTAWYRFSKFARRNKVALAIASLAVAGVLFGIVGLGINNRLVNREKEQTAAALDRVMQEKERADENLARARQAVKQYLLKTSESVELRAADFHDLRKKLLETAIPFYVQFAQETRDDPNLEAERAQTHFDLSKVRQEIGDLERALSDLAEAESIYSRLIPTNPDFTLHQRLAETYSARAGILQELGRNDPADQAYQKSFDTLEAVASTNASRVEYRDSMARMCSNRGEFLVAFSRPREAEALLGRSITLREGLLKDRPDDAALRVQLARSWINLGLALRELRRRDDAEKAFQTAADFLDPQILDKLGATREQLADWQKARGHAYNNLGVVRREAGRLADAAEPTRTSVKIKEQMSEQFPSVPQYRFELAGGYTNLGTLLKQGGQPGEARAAYERAIQINERLVAASPAVPVYAVALAGAYINLGRHIGDAGELETSLPWLTKAVEALEGHYRRDSRVAKVRESLQTAYWARAMTLCGLQRYRDALPDWDRAINLDDGKYSITLRFKRASNLLNLNDHSRAAADAQTVSDNPNATAKDLYLAAGILAHAVRLAHDNNSLTEQYGARAVAVLRQAAAKGYPNPERWKEVGDLEPVRDRADFRELLDGLGVKRE